MSAERVISLIASATEIVCALGFRSRLVGRSHECDFPEGIAGLPVLTRPKFPTDRPSAEIDASVRRLVAEGLSVYEVDVDRLGLLRPDVIVTQSQCEVCAVSLADVERAVCKLVGSRPAVVSLEPNGLADVWEDIGRVARALGVAGRGDDLVTTLRGRMEAIAARAGEMAPRPRVACIEWVEPLMAAGNWVPELVRLAGGENLFGVPGRHAPGMKWKDLVREDPDVIVLLPCGFDLARTLEDVPLLEARPEWKTLRAVRSGRVFATDGNQYFNRPGPRLAESLEILAEILHPGAFRFGHEGRGWERVGVPA